MGSYWLEEHGLCLISCHIAQRLGLLGLIFIIALIISWNCANNGRDGLEQLMCTHSGACSITHVLSLLLSLLKPVHSQHLPCTCLKILLVIVHNSCELSILE